VADLPQMQLRPDHAQRNDAAQGRHYCRCLPLPLRKPAARPEGV